MAGDTQIAKDPQSAGADETRENILEVAAREFADKGLAGARIDEIAEKTNASKRMIYYYFGGKDELYRAVLERAYRNIRQRETQADFKTPPPQDALAIYVGDTFDYHARHPEFVRLVMNENIHRGEHINQIEGIRDLNKSAIATLRTILERGQKEGVFRKGIDPIDLHMSISSLSFFNVSNRYTFHANFGVDMGSPKSMKRRRATIIDIILSFCRA